MEVPTAALFWETVQIRAVAWCLDALAMPGFMVKHGEGSHEKHLISWDSMPTSLILPL